MRRCLRFWGAMILGIALVIVPGSAGADTKKEKSSLEDVLSGFEDSGFPAAEEGAAETSAPLHTPSRWDFQGAFTLSTNYNVNHDSPPPGETDHRGWSRLRAELDLQLDVDIYKSWRFRISGRGFYDGVYEIQDDNDYTRKLINEYEDEVEFRETYIEGSPWSFLDVKVGRQIVVWGNTENFRVTDVLNPMDNRTPGLVDIEDLRLPVCMAKVDFYHGNYNLMAAVVPELRFDKIPVYGSDFFPAAQPLPPDERLARNPDNAELALAFSGILPGWDFSLYAARYFHDEAHYETIGQQMVGQMEVSPGVYQPVYQPVYERQRDQLWMGGASVNVASGDWMLKTELAYTNGYEFNRTRDAKSRLDTLLGVEYTGLTDISMTLEVVRNHYFDFDREMELFPDYTEETVYQAAFRYTQNLMYDRLELTFLALLQEVEGDDTTIERLSAAYDVTDRVTVTGGAIFYQGGDQVGYETLHKNNRAFLDVKYSF